MTEKSTMNGNGPAPTPDPAVLRAEIQRTRAELGETVAALAAKTDVKARASHAAADVRERASHAAADVRERTSHAAADVRERAGAVVRAPMTWTFAAAGALGGALIWLAWRQLSRSR